MEFDSQKCLLDKLSMQIGLCSFLTLLSTKTQTQNFVSLRPTSLLRTLSTCLCHLQSCHFWLPCVAGKSTFADGYRHHMLTIHISIQPTTYVISMSFIGCHLTYDFRVICWPATFSLVVHYWIWQSWLLT